MKLARVLQEGSETLALAMEAQWIDLSRAWQEYVREVEGVDAQSIRDMRQLLTHARFSTGFCRRILEYLQESGRMQAHVLQEPTHFLQPLRPGKIIAIGRNYAAHVKEFDNQMPEEPIFFAKSPTACIGPERPIVVRDWFGRVDHEGELAVIIGQEVKDVAPELAQACIAGYTLINDVTAREMQRADMEKGQPWYRSKNLDTFCPMGPTVALPEAVNWPVELDITVRVNGETRQKSNTRMFLFKLETVISYISRHMTLEPGDVIATGTPEGVGPLRPGDVVEVEVPEIGVLRNPVAGE